MAVTSSRNAFHSFRSSCLFWFLSSSTKLKMAIFSSSVFHTGMIFLQFQRYNSFNVRPIPQSRSPKHLPCERCCHLFAQECLQVLQEFHLLLLRASFHRSRRRCVLVADRLFVLCRSARDVFAGVFVHAPTVASRTVALHTLIPTVRCTLWHIQCVGTVLQQISTQG